jgi:uncharacterized protein
MHLGLTIAPTLDCNYNCFYCFEEHHQEYMTSAEIQSIVRYIETKKDIQSLNITWFGGEPLMAADRIIEFYEKFKQPIKAIYSSIITNGYYMTPEIVKMFKKNNINRVQISIDGIEDDYNAIKYSKSDQNCWNTIVKNIDYIIIKTNININIRVNLQTNDANKFMKIASFFKNRHGDHKYLYIAPAFLSTNRITEKQNKKSHLIEKNDQILFDLDVSRMAIENNMREIPLSIYPSNMINECPVRNENFTGIGPGGLLYKCWENIGNKKECYGFLDMEGKINITNYTLFYRYLYGEESLADPICQKCKFFPICIGGCPHWRLRNFYENAKIDICTHFKSGLSKYLEKRIELFINKKSN